MSGTRRAESSPPTHNLATIIGGGVDTYWYPELPATTQVFLAIRLLGMPDELTEEVPHTTVSRIKNPAGDVLAEAQGEIRIGAAAARPDWLVGVTIPTMVVFEAAEEGTYTIELDFDDATAALPIHVVHGLPPGMAA